MNKVLSVKYFLKIFIVFSLTTAGYFSPAHAQALEELLDLNIEELLEVNVTTASIRPQAIKEVPATVRIVTAKQIEERGYFTLEELLADLPGFQFRNIQGFNSYSFMRGVPHQNNLILVLVDGIQINELNSGGFYGGGQYNLVNVKHVEIVYGPASAIYGTNAVSGIINIITYDPGDHPQNKADLIYGSHNTKMADFRYSFFNKDREFGFTVSGMSKQTDKGSLEEEEGDMNWSDTMENFEDDVSFDSKFQYKKLSGCVILQDKKASRTTNYTSTGTSYLDTGTRWHISFTNMFLQYSDNLNPSLSYFSKLYYRNATVEDDTVGYITTNSGQAGYYRPNSLTGIDNRVIFSNSEKSKYIAGLVYETEKISESFSTTLSGDPELLPPKPDKPQMMSNHLLSVYLQAQYKLNSQTELTLGFRHDDSSFYGNVNTPRAAIVFNKKDYYLKLMYMEAFRAPRPWDYNYGSGNPNLKPEKMKSYELSLGKQISDHLLCEVMVYNNQINDIFNKVYSGDQVYWGNSGTLKTRGVECEVSYIKKHMRTYFNYTYNSSIVSEEGFIPEISRHSGNAGFHVSPTEHTIFDFRLNYIGKRKNPSIIESTQSEYVDSSVIAHCTVSYTLSQRMKLQLICNNLFDSTYYHTSNRPPDRYRQEDRRFLLKLGIHY